VILPPKKNYIPQFLKQRDINSYYIATIDLPNLLQENMWTDPGNMQIAHRNMNAEIGTQAVAIPRKGIHKWDFRYSVAHCLTHLYPPSELEREYLFSADSPCLVSE
jgi:hypothetical protein